MKKNDVFTFTAPNGVEVTAVALDCISSSNTLGITNIWICYAQNKIFTYIEEQHDFTGFSKCDVTTNYKYGKVLVNHAILPDYDKLLQLRSSMEYPQWEQNLEAEIQGMNDR